MEGKFGRVSCSKITGYTVFNKAGLDLGRIHDVVIDLASGKIIDGLLTSRALGFGDKLFAIPWGLFEASLEEGKLILDVTRDKLENAPCFDMDRWPDFRDEKWNEDIFRYYGFERYWRKAA